MKDDKAYLLVIALKFDLENCTREIDYLRRFFPHDTKLAMHSKRTLALVMVTSKNSYVLVDSMRRALDANCIENYWCLPCPATIVGKNRDFDPLSEAAIGAHEVVRKRREAKNMPPAKSAGEVFTRHGVKDAEKSAAIKMGMKGLRRRKSSRDSERPKAG